MNVVLLSGGSGKRLWPLSGNTRPKQFLPLLLDEQGEPESMVRRVLRQLRAAHPGARVFVSANVSQAALLREQLGAVETILEPARRDTFPAVALAAAYLRYEKKLDEDEAFLVCPIDVFAGEKYFALLAEVERLAASGQHAIGLLGAVPTYPSEKYGYILQEGGAVTGFVEKPPHDQAARLTARGALWNCGVFALKIGYVLRRAERYASFGSFESLYAQYDKLPRISFDYEVVEREPSIGAVVYDGLWKDLGTWNTLTQEMGGSALGGRVLLSEGCENTHVLNMLDLPVIAQDLQDIVVVAGPDGILVSSKNARSSLKTLVEGMEAAISPLT